MTGLRRITADPAPKGRANMSDCIPAAPLTGFPGAGSARRSYRPSSTCRLLWMTSRQNPATACTRRERIRSVCTASQIA